MTERRDYRTRAATFQRVLEQLRHNRAGVRVAELERDQLSAPAVERIVKRLALRGLVRIMDGRWLPQPILVADQFELRATAV